MLMRSSRKGFKAWRKPNHTVIQNPEHKQLGSDWVDLMFDMTAQNIVQRIIPGYFGLKPKTRDLLISFVISLRNQGFEIVDVSSTSVKDLVALAESETTRFLKEQCQPSR